MPRLTLCMIARDEEQMLPGCLESVKGIVDEIVLVDTGSRDRTMEVARRHGARVYERPWDDDFAAARNEALAHAQGDFVLQLDADERLAPGAGRAIRKALRDSALNVGMLRLHNTSAVGAPPGEVLSGRARLGNAMPLPRLMRRVHGLEYEGLVHETVDEWAVRNGFGPSYVDADIIHLGAVPGYRISRGKVERNLALLRRRCAREPDSITPFAFLAVELLENGHFEEAEEVIEKGWALVPVQPRYRLIHLLAVARAHVAMRKGDISRVLETVRMATERDGASMDMHSVHALALEAEVLGLDERHPRRRALLSEAADLHRRTLSHTGGRHSLVITASPWSTLTRLGTVLLLDAQPREASLAFEAALAAKPGLLEAQLGIAEAWLDGGDALRCLKAAEPHLGERPDGWLLSAAAAIALGAREDARTFFTRACRLARSPGYVARHRAARHERLAALLVEERSVESDTAALLAALIERRPVPPQVAGAKVERGLLARMASDMMARGQAELLVPLLEPRAEQEVPGLPGQLREVLASLGAEVVDEPAPGV